jgi:phytoene dehydrogenase-like protein
MHEADCIVVGGGLAGLACCRELLRRGRSVVLVEASGRLGGRVATESVDGFRVDRGFQVYLDAYPEGKRQLDLAALRLGGFEPGAIVAEGRRLRTIADPWKRPLTAIRGVWQGVIGPGDALRMARLRANVLRALRAGRLDPTVQSVGASTRAELARLGFSEAFVKRFFVPFFGGVFLERELATSADVFRFSFAMFASGRACLPYGGMDAIPRQLAACLPPDSIRMGIPADAVEPGCVRLADGSTLRAAGVVVATSRASAAALLPERFRGAWAGRRDKATTLVAFAAPRSPLPRATILVVASGEGPIDNLTVPSDVAGGYAPPGSHLVCVSVREDRWPAPHPPRASDEPLREAIRGQAEGWFGETVRQWRHLTTIRVAGALPDESPEARGLRPSSSRLTAGLFLCGDHCSTASINGALESGRACARDVAAEAAAGP